MRRALSDLPTSSPPSDTPVALSAPDISRWQDGNTGVDYAHTFDSGRPGPHALVTTVVHGNEIGGAIALDRLLREGPRPRRGRLTVAFANVAAFERFDARDPTASRFVDEDLNRVWAPEVLDGPRDSAELRRARALRPLVAAADVLLDLHSLQQGDEPLALSGPLEKGRALAARVGVPEIVVADAGHAAGTRLRDHGAFGDPDGPEAALLVECGQHWARGTERVACEVTRAFLATLGMIEALPTTRRPPPQRVIEVTHAVTVECDTFAFAAPYRGLEVIAEAGSEIARDGGRPVRTPYDDCVLVMPSRRLHPGQTAVRLGRRIA
jgi:predicted deacylase